MIVIVIFQSCWMTPEGTPSMKIPGVPFGQVNGTVEVVSAEDSKGPVMGALVAAEISDNLPQPLVNSLIGMSLVIYVNDVD